MDVAMSNEESFLAPKSLQDYVSRYTGHQRYARLLSIINAQNADRLPPKKLAEAAELGYTMSVAEKLPGMHQRIQQSVTAHFKTQEK
jgi:hypothetical protein